MPPEDQQQTEAPAAAAAAPPAGAAQQAQAASAEDTISLDEAKKLRSESASLRKRLKELESAEEQRQQAALSDQEKALKQAEKLQAERDALAASLRTERARGAIAREASRLGLDAELAERLALGALEYDDSGQPTNAPKVLEALVKAHPYLVSRGTTAAGNPARQAAGGTQETAEQRRARLYGNGGNIFDPAAARARGGGVVTGESQE